MPWVLDALSAPMTTGALAAGRAVISNVRVMDVRPSVDLRPQIATPCAKGTIATSSADVTRNVGVAVKAMAAKRNVTRIPPADKIASAITAVLPAKRARAATSTAKAVIVRQIAATQPSVAFVAEATTAASTAGI